MEEDFAAVHRIDTAPPADAGRKPNPPSSDPRSFAASTRLEQFVLLAKSARGAGAASLVDQVTAAPGVYAFGELLDTKAIAELESSDQYASKWRVLQIFAYGTLQEYRKDPSLPILSAAQLHKLRCMTLIELASRQRAIPFASLAQQLAIASNRELEEFIIEAMYADLLRGRLDQKRQMLEIETVIGRDVRPVSDSMTATHPHHTVTSLIAGLSAWQDRVSTTLAQLDHHLQQIRHADLAQKQQADRQSKHVQHTIADVQKSASNKQAERDHIMNAWATNGAASAADDAEMIMDGDERLTRRSPNKPANRKRTRP